MARLQRPLVLEIETLGRALHKMLREPLETAVRSFDDPQHDLMTGIWPRLNGNLRTTEAIHLLPEAEQRPFLDRFKQDLTALLESTQTPAFRETFDRTPSEAALKNLQDAMRRASRRIEFFQQRHVSEITR